MSAAAKPVVELAAACACGATETAVKGRILSMFMCSCEDCQKATGTGHSTVALAARRDVEITGEARSFARPADSGAIFTRWFCPACGTPLYGESSRAPEIIMLPIGLFGSAAAGWFAPNQLIFARSHRDWDLIPDRLPLHATYRDNGRPGVSAASDALAARLRPLLAATPGIVEKKMFGGIGFMLNGNMAIGTTAKGELLVRIDPDRQADALARRGAHQMQMGVRPMTGFIAVSEAGTPDAAALSDWIDYALNFAKALPPK